MNRNRIFLYGRRKMLFAGDLHKRMKDKTTIRGYARNTIDVELELMRILREEGFTDFISIGDWFDQGYGSDVAAALTHTDIDKLLQEQMNGNFYGLIGNHIKINMDSNPELFLIQPHQYYTTRHRVVRKEQILKTPDELWVNGVQISFNHWNRNAEHAGDYYTPRDLEAKYHIGLFHTPMVIPSSRLRSMGITTIVNENSHIFNALDGVDLAIVGDIHKPLGTFKIEKNEGLSTTMIVPGSLTNTDAGEGSMHNSIEMPVVEIDEEGHVQLSYRHMDLFTNRVTFLKKEIEEKAMSKMKTLRGNNVTTLYESLETSTFGSSDAEEYQSLNAFIAKQGYTESDRELVKAILNTPEDVDSMVRTYKTGQSI